jgi:20S proteasome alpha/beta subunit
MKLDNKNKITVLLSENSTLVENMSKDEIRKLVRDELEKLLRDKETKKEIADITKKMLKKLYRELSFNSTHIVDQLDIS